MKKVGGWKKGVRRSREHTAATQLHENGVQQEGGTTIWPD